MGFFLIFSFRYLTTNKSVDYTNWYSIDQPNNGDGAGEHCVISVPDGMYNPDELAKCSRMLKIGPLDIFFPSNHNIHKSSSDLCFWAPDP